MSQPVAVSMRQDGELLAAVQSFGESHPEAVGWAEAPQAAWWVRLSNGELTTMLDKELPAGRSSRTAVVGPAAASASPAFRLRLFTKDDELRWDFDPGQGRGQWAVVNDEVAASEGLSPHAPLGRLLLWGKIARVQDGWVRLDDARIGSLWVPLTTGAPEPGDRIAGCLQEYTSTDRYGNVAVADERWCGLRVVKENSRKKEAAS